LVEHVKPIDRNQAETTGTTWAAGRSEQDDAVGHPLDLDAFCQWMGTLLGLATPPGPSANLARDLGVDDFGMLSIVVKFDQLLADEGHASDRVYRNAATVRDLHLYYLYLVSAPAGLAE